jgi:uncharacterized integral membrane protein
MFLFFILLIVAAVLIGVFSYQNTATHDMTFLQWHFSGVPLWVPVVLAAAAVGVILLLWLLALGATAGMRHGALRRRLGDHESSLGNLRQENTRLREENARLRSEMRGMERGSDRAPVAVGTEDRGSTMDRSEETTADRSDEPRRTAEPYRPRMTFGERVRAFFSGREPAGY